MGRLNRQQKRRQIQNTVPYRAHQGHTVWDLAAGAEHQHSLTTVHPHLPDHAANEPPTGIVVVNRPAQLRYSIARGPQQMHVVAVLDGALLHVDDPQVAAQRVIADDDFVPTEGERGLHPIPILPWRRAYRLPHHAAGTLQHVLQMCAHQPGLVLQLCIIREVLPLTASAHAEVPALRDRGVGGFPHQRHDLALGAPPAARNFDDRLLPGQCERHRHAQGTRDRHACTVEVETAKRQRQLLTGPQRNKLTGLGPRAWGSRATARGGSGSSGAAGLRSSRRRLHGFSASDVSTFQRFNFSTSL